MQTAAQRTLARETRGRAVSPSPSRYTVMFGCHPEKKDKPFGQTDPCKAIQQKTADQQAVTDRPARTHPWHVSVQVSLFTMIFYLNVSSWGATLEARSRLGDHQAGVTQ
jgi:hypothetical protein